MSRDTNFAYAFLALPRPKREAIVAVWDFCRAVDDEVDEPSTTAPALEEWRAELTRLYEGGAPARTPQGQALAPWISRFSLPRQAFSDLIDGVEMDLTCDRYATFGDLYEYCWRVAGTVGLICLEIFGYRRSESRDYALALGVALQITNIVRDVASDLRRNRIYVPQEDLRRFGCTEDDLRNGIVTTEMRALLRFQCHRAEDFFGRARAVLPRDDARRLVAAEIMGGIYRDILRRIQAADYDVFSAPIRVPRPRRAWIAGWIWARTLVGLGATS
jgi:phytoene synthase